MDEDVPFVGEPAEEPPALPPASAGPDTATAVEPEPPPSEPLETDADADSDSDVPREPTFLGKSWPIFAAVLLIAATLVAVFSLLSPRPAGATAAAAAGTPAFVTIDSAELRREPSATAEALATLEAGERVEAFGARGTWLEVESDGKRGFLPVDVVERESDREARQRREKMLLSFTPVYGVVGDATDVILAPYPLAPRAGRVAKGTVIAIHSVDHSYFAFRDKTWGIAFVSSAAVDLIPPDPSQPAIEPEKVKPLKNLTVIDLEGEPPPDEPLDELADEDAASEESPAPVRPPPVAAAPGAPASAGGLLEGPALISRVEPVYPDLARRAGIEGTVELEVSIDPAGAVTDVEVVRGLPLGMSEAAAAAVHRWKYKPARTATGPVASRKSVRIRFVLRGD
ncbi:MAG: TonB family protein [Thermoanaerobaculia bacterium]